MARIPAPANLVGALEKTARSGIALAARAKWLDRSAASIVWPRRETAPGPACLAEVHSVWRAQAAPSAVADRALAYLQSPAVLGTGDPESLRSDARHSWARHAPARRMNSLP